MTGGTDIGDVGYTWRTGSVVAMTCSASGRAEVTAHGQGSVMNALAVSRKLICRDLVAAHVAGICMAMRASGRHIGRMHFGLRIAGRPQVMDAVTIHTDRHLCVARSQSLAVNAGLVLA